jgi:hypothetical protein
MLPILIIRLRIAPARDARRDGAVGADERRVRRFEPDPPPRRHRRRAAMAPEDELKLAHAAAGRRLSQSDESPGPSPKQLFDPPHLGAALCRRRRLVIRHPGGSVHETQKLDRQRKYFLLLARPAGRSARTTKDPMSLSSRPAGPCFARPEDRLRPGTGASSARSFSRSCKILHNDPPARRATMECPGSAWHRMSAGMQTIRSSHRRVPESRPATAVAVGRPGAGLVVPNQARRGIGDRRFPRTGAAQPAGAVLEQDDPNSVHHRRADPEMGRAAIRDARRTSRQPWHRRTRRGNTRARCESGADRAAPIPSHSRR